MLIIICGLPGSGKSTLARALSRHLAASLISSDLTRRSMFPKPSYSEEEKSAVYSSMADEVSEMLREGKDVVVDATFYRARERGRFIALAESAGTEAHIVMTTLAEEEIRRRLARRGRGSASDADFSVYFKVKGLFEQVEGRHLVVDSALPERDKVRMVAEFVGR
jgi:predicted kinase